MGKVAYIGEEKKGVLENLMKFHLAIPTAWSRHRKRRLKVGKLLPKERAQQPPRQSVVGDEQRTAVQ